MKDKHGTEIKLNDVIYYKAEFGMRIGHIKMRRGEFAVKTESHMPILKAVMHNSQGDVEIIENVEGNLVNECYRREEKPVIGFKE